VSETDLKHTPLYDRHLAAGGRMVPFAGYAMPVQYPTASWPSIAGPASTPVCSTSATWARPGWC
jgi:glycine cleavage system aminomethyltransferase T